jgi:hypothetical protein
MKPDRRDNPLVRFLTHELAISDAAIAIALKQCTNDTDPLPMILWQYGLLTLEQLNRTFDWLSNQNRTVNPCPLTLLIR